MLFAMLYMAILEAGLDKIRGKLGFVAPTKSLKMQILKNNEYCLKASQKTEDFLQESPLLCSRLVANRIQKPWILISSAPR